MVKLGGRCKDYRNQVQQCRKHFTKFKNLIAASGGSFLAVSVILGANVLCPATVALDLVLNACESITVSAAAEAVENYFSARSSYKDLTNSYDVIKNWGRKL